MHQKSVLHATSIESNRIEYSSASMCCMLFGRTNSREARGAKYGRG
eukprot:CAMPEP_0206614512 /NCGR_PEP_ID=MMETSP0325_2-20121206/57447_1 /ASSEMBLY_ACC=CAM_ASM_000347 /TAXON_ID=2866 /ORGANISM="Crypthecodinium cohnii, Strain Seligo" /LENGTH=45 /DNA_ID= /DNA_START= /DNA_END= /DNA_ORIENTATION=